MTAAPDVAYRNHNTFSPKNPSANKWLMVKVKYTLDICSDFTPQVSSRKNTGMRVSFPGWLDNAELKVWAVFDTGSKVKDEPVWVLFTGKTVFHSIKRNGKEHLAVMFLPAKMLDRYCSHWGGGATKAAKTSFLLKAEMFHHGKSLKVAFSSNVPGKNNEGREVEFERILTGVSKQLMFENSLLPRSRSPWALLAPDDYDLEVEKSVGSVQE